MFMRVSQVLRQAAVSSRSWVVGLADTLPSTAWSERLKTWSTKPYSLASSALNQRSRSESFSIWSTVWPVCSAMSCGHLLLDVEHLLGLDLDVGGRAADAARGLVHHDAGVRAWRSACPGVPADSRNWPIEAAMPIATVATSLGIQLHRVEDGHAGGDRAAGAVDVEPDVLLGVLGRRAAAAARRWRSRCRRARRTRGR